MVEEDKGRQLVETMANEYVEELMKSCKNAMDPYGCRVDQAMKASLSKGPSPTKQSIVVFGGLSAIDEDGGFSLQNRLQVLSRSKSTCMPKEFSDGLLPDKDDVTSLLDEESVFEMRNTLRNLLSYSHFDEVDYLLNQIFA